MNRPKTWKLRSHSYREDIQVISNRVASIFVWSELLYGNERCLGEESHLLIRLLQERKLRPSISVSCPIEFLEHLCRFKVCGSLYDKTTSWKSFLFPHKKKTKLPRGFSSAICSTKSPEHFRWLQCYYSKGLTMKDVCDDMPTWPRSNRYNNIQCKISHTGRNRNIYHDLAGWELLIVWALSSFSNPCLLVLIQKWKYAPRFHQ